MQKLPCLNTSSIELNLNSLDLTTKKPTIGPKALSGSLIKANRNQPE